MENKKKHKKLSPEETEILRKTDALYEQLNLRRELLRKLLVEKELACSNAPEGSIHIVHNGPNRQNIQYYLRENPSEANGTYLKKGNDNLIRSLIQKEYDKKLVQKIRKEIKCLDRLLASFPESPLTHIYQSFSDAKKVWISPVFQDDLSYIAQWKNKSYEKMGFKNDAPVFYTQKNEPVRSKSEVIIANLLDSYHVPYLYEYPLYDKTGIWARPDFFVLNVRTRTEFFWEHFGMLDDTSYLSGALRKISSYEQHNLYQGRNLLLSYESSTSPLNTKEVEGLIKGKILLN